MCIALLAENDCQFLETNNVAMLGPYIIIVREIFNTIITISNQTN